MSRKPEHTLKRLEEVLFQTRVELASLEKIVKVQGQSLNATRLQLKALDRYVKTLTTSALEKVPFYEPED